MIIGVPKEVKDHESRVGIVPSGVKALVDAGHKVLVETRAGELSSMPDQEYKAAGAEIAGSAQGVWSRANMVVKVKEPVASEFQYLRDGLVLFTYLHLAPLPDLTNALLKNNVTGIAYETIRDRNGALPLLTPMSEVAGRMSVQVGAAYLEKERGGLGILLGGVPGVPPANVCVIGGGIVGTNAAKIALGMGAITSIIDLSLNRLRELDDIFNGRIYTRNVNKAFRAMRDLYSGITYINAPTIGAEVHLPFGGTKATGNGHREGGIGAIDFYTEWKTLYIDYSDKLQRAQIDRPE